MFFHNGFFAQGEVRIAGTRISGNLECTGGDFINAGGHALICDQLDVKGNVFLNGGFSAVGTVRLFGAKIGGDLQSAGGSILNSDSIALSAEQIVVSGGVFLYHGFSATGSVDFIGGRIGGNLDCRGSTFANPNGIALRLDGIVLNGGAFLNNGFSASGQVNLRGAHIRGNLECNDGRFLNPDKCSLSADQVNVGGALIIRTASIDGGFELTSAKVATLLDDTSCWQSGGHLFDGFVYDQILGPTDAKARIKWLEQQRPDQVSHNFKPQPWEQLITVLREMGHSDDAAEVAIAKQLQLRKAHAKSRRSFGEKVRRGLHWVYGWFAGYGHRPIWAVYWMAGVCALWSLAFYVGRETGHFGPTNPLIHASDSFDACGSPGEVGKDFWTSKNCPTPPEYTTFQPFFYSLDLILPLVNLQQEADWAPLVVNPAGETLWLGRFLRWMMWFEILFGWIASLTLAAVLGKLVDKD